MQKVEISVIESCVKVDKFARLTPTQKGLCTPQAQHTHGRRISQLFFRTTCWFIHSPLFFIS
jgi:hypothetical protein